MGFSGSFVLCRSAVGFEEITAVWSRDEGLVWSEDRAQEWRIGQWLETDLADQAVEMLAELVRETGRPALTGYVVDSDCVDIHGLGVTTDAWRACLAREAMAGYLDEADLDLDGCFPDPEAAARSAEAWAREAGLGPDATTLRLLFAVEQADPLAEDLFFDLVDRLGVPPPFPDTAAQRKAVRIMNNRDIATELRRYEGQVAFDTGPFGEQITLVNHLYPPASEREVAECFAERILPEVLAELWGAAREGTLFKDSAYGQSGLELLAPADAVAATVRLYDRGPVAGALLADVFVFGKFIGEQEHLALHHASGAVVVVPELPNIDEGVVVAQDLAEFLRTFREANGDKYWE